MKTATALTHFKSKYNIAKQLGITRQSVGDWGDIVPFKKAIRLQEMSRNKIKVDHDCYKE